MELRRCGFRKFARMRLQQQIRKNILNTVHQTSASLTKKDHRSTSVGMYGMPLALMGLEGCEFVGAVKLKDPVEGISFLQQVQEIERKSGAEMAQEFTKAGNIGVKLTPGTFLFVPAGFVMFTFSSQASMVLRRTFTCPNDTNESSVVLQVVDQQLEAFSVLRKGPWAEWRQYLTAV